GFGPLTPMAKARQGKPGRASKRRRMARRRKRRILKPSVPKRVKQRKKRARKSRGHQHPELVGLGLVAVGLFLVAVLWAGWNGGAIAGVHALLVGALLVTGASAGAILRSSTLRVRESQAAWSRRRAQRRQAPPLRVIDGDRALAPPEPQAPPVDVVGDFPDML